MKHQQTEVFLIKKNDNRFITTINYVLKENIRPLS